MKIAFSTETLYITLCTKLHINYHCILEAQYILEHGFLTLYSALFTLYSPAHSPSGNSKRILLAQDPPVLALGQRC
jgi:hypothetical protein